MLTISEVDDAFTDRYWRLSERQRERVYKLMTRIADAYPDDPGTSDLYDEQPVTLSINLGDVRLAQQLVR
jgi:hypothetical protein